MANRNEITEAVRTYLLNNLFDSSSAHELNDSTPLISSGILDSISTLQVVSFLEETFHVEIQPSDLNEDHFNTVSQIADLVQARSGQ
jgi:acyl carrier protein